MKKNTVIPFVARDRIRCRADTGPCRGIRAGGLSFPEPASGLNLLWHLPGRRPGDAPAIAAASAAELTAALEQAGKENFIAPLAAEEIEALIERVKGPALIAATTSACCRAGRPSTTSWPRRCPMPGLQGRLLGAS